VRLEDVSFCGMLKVGMNFVQLKICCWFGDQWVHYEYKLYKIVQLQW